MENREILRKTILKQRQALTQEILQSNSNRIFLKLIHSSLFLNCDAIFTYVAFQNEVETRNLIHYALKKEKKIGLPMIKDNSIKPVEFTHWEDLSPGYAGILEPQVLKPFDFTALTLILVPGIVFDKQGNRLGFGKGFYDRFLKNKPQVKIGLAHSFQLVDRIEAQKTDVPIDYLITETDFIDFKKNCLNIL